MDHLGIGTPPLFKDQKTKMPHQLGITSLLIQADWGGLATFGGGPFVVPLYLIFFSRMDPLVCTPPSGIIFSGPIATWKYSFNRSHPVLVPSLFFCWAFTFPICDLAYATAFCNSGRDRAPVSSFV